MRNLALGEGLSRDFGPPFLSVRDCSFSWQAHSLVSEGASLASRTRLARWDSEPYRSGKAGQGVPSAPILFISTREGVRNEAASGLLLPGATA